MVPSKKSLPVSLKNSVDHFINLFKSISTLIAVEH